MCPKPTPIQNRSSEEEEEKPLSDSNGSDERIKRRALAGTRGLRVGARPGDAELVVAVAVVAPDAVGVANNKALELVVGPGLVEVPQVPQEDALELLAVDAAQRAVLLAARGLDEDALVAGQGLDGGLGDAGGGVEERSVSSGLVELDEPPEDDALVVGPGRLAVVLALIVEAVVDEVVLVDEAAVLKPRPLFVGNLQVLGVAGDAVREGRSHGEVELVGDGADVFAVLLPVDAAVARGALSGLHILEDADGGVEILLLAGHIVGADQGESPPALVVIVLVEEVGEASRAHAAQLVSGLDQTIGLVYLAGFHRRLLGVCESVAHVTANVQLVCFVKSEGSKVGIGCESVGTVPPCCVPNTSGDIIPCRVHRLDALDCVGDVVVGAGGVGDGSHQREGSNARGSQCKSHLDYLVMWGKNSKKSQGQKTRQGQRKKNFRFRRERMSLMIQDRHHDYSAGYSRHYMLHGVP